MSLWKIAWRSIQQRSLASSLTAISMALGVSLVVAVLVIHAVVYQAFHRGEGYDLIVGAKGSSLELVLNSVYYMGQAIPTIPYQDFKDLDEGVTIGHLKKVVPICLGDTCEGFRVVATIPEMFEDSGDEGEAALSFAEGENFKKDNYYDAVLGSAAAQSMGVKVGGTVRPGHGIAGGKEHKHREFNVVGILAPTGTPKDRAVFINIEGFYRVGGHTGEADADEDDNEHEHEHEHEGPVPDEKKKVTAVLVCLEDHATSMTRGLARKISDRPRVQAAIPCEVIENLFDKVIGNIELVLLLFAVMIVLVAGIGIMVSIYNSMSDRRHEIAIMRALGARRTTVMLVILLESILLSVGGGILGLLLGHGLIDLAAPLIAAKTGLSVGLLQFRAAELILIPSLIGLASLVGYLPAVAAYRTDVARSLTAAP